MSKGFTTATGAAAVSVFGAAAAASALLFGWLSDRYGRAQILALATLTRARKIAIANGVRYAYTGNVHDQEGGSTHRHGCGAKLIGRDGYEITAWNLNAEGKCRRCGSACAGIFEASPGAWGARRQPVRLKNFAA